MQSINFRPLSTNAVQSLFGIYCQKGQHEHDNEIQCEPFLHKNIDIQCIPLFRDLWVTVHISDLIMVIRQSIYSPNHYKGDG